MTQKHFIALADAFRISEPLKGTHEYEQWIDDRNTIAAVCSVLNPNFNRELWIDYIDGKVPSKGRRPK